MTTRDDRIVTSGVSLCESDWAIIDDTDTYDAGRSATLRRIIREWRAMQDRTLIDTPAQYITAQIPEGE